MKKRIFIFITLLAIIVISMTAIAAAGYDIPAWTTNGGGGTNSSGGGYRLSGVAGQAEVGPQLSGGDYLLDGGIGEGSVQRTLIIFLPLVANQ